MRIIILFYIIIIIFLSLSCKSADLNITITEVYPKTDDASGIIDVKFCIPKNIFSIMQSSDLLSSPIPESYAQAQLLLNSFNFTVNTYTITQQEKTILFHTNITFLSLSDINAFLKPLSFIQTQLTKQQNTFSFILALQAHNIPLFNTNTQSYSMIILQALLEHIINAYTINITLSANGQPLQKSQPTSALNQNKTLMKTILPLQIIINNTQTQQLSISW